MIVDTPPQSSERSTRGALGLLFACLAACSAPEMPPAQSALEAYAAAIESKDANALFEMMTERARAEFSREEIEQLLKRDGQELLERCRAMKVQGGPERSEATLFLEGDRSVLLNLEEAGFRVVSAGLVPRQPRTPEDAAEQLRAAVRARSYEGIKAALTEAGREEFERAFSQLNDSLDQLDSAVVEVRQDRATIEFSDGRVITLRRSGDVWRVEALQ